MDDLDVTFCDDFVLGQAGAAARGLSHSEITLAAEQAAKASILADRRTMDTETLLDALLARHRDDTHA